MSDSQNIKGLAELEKFLKQVPDKMQKNIMRGALRAGMKEVLPAVQAGVHQVSGELAAGLKIGTASRGDRIWAAIRAKGPHGWLALLLEFKGARAHEIAGRFGRALFFNGTFLKSVMHPGFKPKPFMRPALDAKATAAGVAAGNYVKNKLATKAGLDTSDIQVEGDEP